VTWFFAVCFDTDQAARVSTVTALLPLDL